MINEIKQNSVINLSEYRVDKTFKKKGTAPQNRPDAKLNEEDQKRVEELKAREQEVIAHEQAHRMVGGALVRGAIQYEYETGPDGNRYITGGEVEIDTTPVEANPEATIAKMQLVVRAALAPANPSMQDRKVAQQARSQEAKARVELMQQRLSGDNPLANSLEAAKALPAQYTQNGEKTENQAVSSRVNIWV